MKRTKKQKQWIETYKRLTGGIEPTMATDQKFSLFAQTNIQWLRDHTEEVVRSLEHDLYEIITKGEYR